MTPPTAALPIAACPNRECPSGEVGWCTDEELGTGFYGCDCGYHGPEVHCIWQSGQKFNSAKAEALRLHNLLCAPAVQATADAEVATILAELQAIADNKVYAPSVKEELRAIIRKHPAVSPKAAASKDMVLVPRRATKEMCAAYALQVGYSRMPGDVWDAMISAAVSGDKQEKER